MQALAQDAAQGGDDDAIIVTAQRRAENQQTVPVAVSVVSAATLEAAGSFDPVDLGRQAVGLFANSYNGDRSYIIYTIRGQAYTTGTVFPAVQPYFADVPVTKLYVGTFFDLENVQVLRGPQGTLFGRVTDGGNVLISPAKPKNDLAAELEFKIGNYDLRGYNGMLNVPIIDGKLAVRGAFEIVRRDGFTTNIVDGSKLDGVHYESGRFSVLATPFDGFENFTTLNYTHANETGGSAMIDFVNPPAAGALAPAFVAALEQQQQIGPRKIAVDFPSYDHRKQLIVVNKTDVDITDNTSGSLTLGYIFSKQLTGADGDGSTVPRGGTQLPYGYPSALVYVRQYSADLNFNGTLFDDKLEWTLGAYADRQETPGPAEQSSRIFDFDRIVVQDITTTSTAFFGQLGYDLSSLVDGLKVVGGIRRTSDTAKALTALYFGPVGALPHGQCLAVLPANVFPTASAPCSEGNVKFKQTTWMGNIEWEATDDLFLYAKISKGYRPGGFNNFGVGSAYGPESVISKEIGFKSDWTIAGRSLRLNVAAFYDDFKDIQRYVSQAISAINVNTESATVKGIEAEATFKPANELEIGVRYSLLRAGYNIEDYDPAYVAAACPADPRLQPNDPTKFCPLGPYPRTPRNSGGANIRYTTGVGDGVFSMGADVFWTDGQYVVSTTYLHPEVSIPSYAVVNADASLTRIGGSPIDVRFFVNNLLNKTYASTKSSLSNMGNAGFTTISYGAPRMLGMAVRLSFGN